MSLGAVPRSLSQGHFKKMSLGASRAVRRSHRLTPKHSFRTRLSIQNLRRQGLQDDVLVPPPGAAPWCRPLVPPLGAAPWCRPLVPPPGSLGASRAVRRSHRLTP